MNNARRVAYNTFIQAGSRILINILGVVSVGVTTRYLGLDFYGQLTTATLFVALFSSLSEAGITVTALRELAADESRWPKIIGSIVTLRFTVGVVIAALTVLLAHLIYRDPSHHLVVQAIDYLTITTVFITIQTSLTTVLSVRLRNDLVVIGAIANRVVSLVGIFMVIHYNWGFLGLILATLAGAVINFISDIGFSLGQLRPQLNFDFKYWRYIVLLAAPIGIASIINMLYIKIDGLMLSVLRSSSEVAIYGVAYKLMDLLTILPSFFTNSVLPLMVAAKGDMERLKSITDKSVRFLDMVSAPLVVGVIVVASHLAVILGGKDFISATWPMIILGVGNIFIYANAGYSNALFIANGQNQMLKVISIVFVTNIAINAVAIPLFGAVGAASAVTISEIVSLFVLRRIYRRILGPDTMKRNVWPFIGTAAAMGVVTYGARLLWFNAPNALNLIILIVIGGVSYAGFLRLFGLLRLSEIKAIMKPS